MSRVELGVGDKIELKWIKTIPSCINGGKMREDITYFVIR